jgi:glycosyltransferase EpsD
MGYRIKRDEIDSSVNVREQLGIPRDSKVLTFVGELSGRKNQIFLIRAMKKLREEGISAYLLLVGEGSERENYKKEIQALGLDDCVLMPGNCEPITPYLAATNLYVSASRIEGLPFNVMEAMSCGLPIVATDTKGQSDLLGQTHADFLYPLNDSNAFCEKVKSLLSQPSLGVGSIAYPLLKQYSLESVFEENINLMKGTLK